MASDLNDEETSRKKSYVREGIFGKGGLHEALNGLWFKTIPFLIGAEFFTFPRFLSGLVRMALVAAAALFPIILRKAITGTTGQPTSAVASMPDAVALLWRLLQNLDSLDIVLMGIAILITVAPKALEVFGRKKEDAQHSPYYDLAAAIQGMPPCVENQSGASSDESLKLVLEALRIEMSELIGDETQKRLTEVTLLEFCDLQGTKMQVRSRTANHELVRRPVLSTKFVAYFVARFGRAFAEHDFLHDRNPFEKVRLTVIGGPPVHYRSVLYIPIMCSELVSSPAEGGSLYTDSMTDVVDSCIGVICIHSPKAYRFWRWGDHNKTTGGFADVAFERSMPYIAVVKRLLEQSAPKVALEAA